MSSAAGGSLLPRNSGYVSAFVVCAVITAVAGAVALVVPLPRPEPVGVPAVREPALASV